MASFVGQGYRISTAAASIALAIMMLPSKALLAADGDGLWPVYQSALKNAKYVDLTHTITPAIPVWAGFAASSFGPAKAGKDIKGFAQKGDAYTYQKHGFEATEYNLKTDQLGTQLDPPAHWAPEYWHLTSCRRPTPSARSSSYRSSSSGSPTPLRLADVGHRGLGEGACRIRRAPSCSSDPAGRKPGPTRSLPP